MKPDWDKLMAAFKDHASTLIADVDCTTGGKSLCEQVGVRGYPTIKQGDPNDLQDYKGGRDFAALKKFAEGLGPQCSPANLDLCDAEKKKQIEEFTALSKEKREEMIKAKEADHKVGGGLQGLCGRPPEAVYGREREEGQGHRGREDLRTRAAQVRAGAREEGKVGVVGVRGGPRRELFA